MRIFIAGKHHVSEIIKSRRLIKDLGFQTSLVRFDKAIGIFIPDLPPPETNCLKQLLEEKTKNQFQFVD